MIVGTVSLSSVTQSFDPVLKDQSPVVVFCPARLKVSVMQVNGWSTSVVNNPDKACGTVGTSVQPGRHLLSPPVPVPLLDSWTEILAGMTPENWVKWNTRVYRAGGHIEVNPSCCWQCEKNGAGLLRPPPPSGANGCFLSGRTSSEAGVVYGELQWDCLVLVSPMWR